MNSNKSILQEFMHRVSSYSQRFILKLRLSQPLSESSASAVTILQSDAGEFHELENRVEVEQELIEGFCSSNTDPTHQQNSLVTSQSTVHNCNISYPDMNNERDRNTQCTLPLSSSVDASIRNNHGGTDREGKVNIKHHLHRIVRRFKTLHPKQDDYRWYLHFLLPFTIIFIITEFASQFFKFSLFAAIWFQNGFFVSSLLWDPNITKRRILILTVVYWITLGTVNLYSNTYPKILGFNIADVLNCLALFFLYGYLCTNRLSSDSILAKTMYYTFSTVISCLLGSIFGALTLYLTVPDINYPNTFFRWFAAEIIVMFAVPPFILSLRQLKEFKFKSKRLHTRILQFFLIAVLPLPIFFSQKLTNSVLGMVIGLYIDFPLVLLSVNWGGFLAGTFSNLLITITSLIYLLLNREEQILGGAFALTPAEFIAAIALFLFILCLVTLLYAGVLLERDLAYSSIENKVKERTEELIKTMQTLVEAQKTAEHLSNDKTNFMAFLCHELRNPLHAIVNLIHILMDEEQEEQNEKSKNGLKSQNIEGNTLQDSCDPPSVFSENQVSRLDLLTSISSFGQHTLNLITDVIDVGRFESGRVPLNMSPIDFTSEIHSLINDFGALIKLKNIHFKSNIPSCFPKNMELDFIRYKQVLSNFVSNAVKATPPKEEIKIDISYRQTESDVNAENISDSQTIDSDKRSGRRRRKIVLKTSLADTGCGIPKEEQSRLFQPYRQVSGSFIGSTHKKDSASGSGLGLSISRMIVELFQGQLTLYSEPGKGSCFSFEIPVFCEEDKEENQKGNDSNTEKQCIVQVDSQNSCSSNQLNRIDERMISEILETRSENSKEPSHTTINLDFSQPEHSFMKESTSTSNGILTQSQNYPNISSYPNLQQEKHELVTNSMIPERTKEDRITKKAINLGTHDAQEDGRTIHDEENNNENDVSSKDSLLCILIVDDSSINRYVLKRMIQKIHKDWEILEAEDGSEAVSIIQSSLIQRVDTSDVDVGENHFGRKIDFIFMDILMPLMNGFDASKLIRNLGFNGPIVATTANNTKTTEFIEKLEVFGLNGALPKPFTVNSIRRVMNEFLFHRKQ